MTEKENKNNEWFYTEVVKEHFFNPRNLMNSKEAKSYKADGIGQVGNAKCGDIMKVWINIDKETDKITDMKWETYGCASAIASTSMLSVMITEKGGTKIDEALKIKPKDIANRLGGLPGIKFHCSVLGDQALRAAISDYKSKKKQ